MFFLRFHILVPDDFEPQKGHWEVMKYELMKGKWFSFNSKERT